MGMMGMMVVMMAVGFAGILLLGFFVLMVSQETTKRKHQFMPEIAEKPKRGYFMLSDDGEFVGIEDHEQAKSEKSKRGY